MLLIHLFSSTNVLYFPAYNVRYIYLWRTFVTLSWMIMRNASWCGLPILILSRKIIKVLYNVLGSTSHVFSVCVKPYAEQSLSYVTYMRNICQMTKSVALYYMHPLPINTHYLSLLNINSTTIHPFYHTFWFEENARVRKRFFLKIHLHWGNPCYLTFFFSRLLMFYLC
jgi:hypothetical protein